MLQQKPQNAFPKHQRTPLIMQKNLGKLLNLNELFSYGMTHPYQGIDDNYILKASYSLLEENIRYLAYERDTLCTCIFLNTFYYQVTAYVPNLTLDFLQ